MEKAFFPDVTFGWSFVGVCLAVLLVAAVVDLRRAWIPKSILATVLCLGLIANILRGCFLANANLPTWQLGAGSIPLGALDGFLFSLVGLLFAFVLYFALWMLGTVGGGDVKLCAGIGAWLGAWYIVWFMLVTVFVMALWVTGRVMLLGLTDVGEFKKSDSSGTPLRNRRMTFAFPAAISAALVMLWFFRANLQLAPAPTP